MIKIVQLGLGPIGQRLTCYLSERTDVKIVGAVDPDSQKAGNDLGIQAGLEAMGIQILPDINSISDIKEADAAIISTLSSLENVEQQIKVVADYHLNIVSTCEELSHPWQIQPERAARLDTYCKKRNIACVGTGVNPGFLMDYLPTVLTSVCRNVEHIEVERIQDAELRRKPFRDKIGIGLSENEFNNNRKTIRHVGLEESVRMIADAMNWELDTVHETLEPVQAEQPIQNKTVQVRKREIAGVLQIAKGYRDQEEVIKLVFKAAVGIKQPHDSIYITGEPDFTSTIPGGINGDIATSAIIVNAVRAIGDAEPGLITMSDLSAPTYFEHL